MKSYLPKIFLGIFLILVSIQCNQKPDKIDSKKLDQIEKEIETLPIKQRLVKWDSLLNVKDLNPLILAYILFDKANDLSTLEKENEALKNLRKALTVFKKYNDRKMIAKTYVNMGISHAYLNHKKRANELIYKGLKIAEELNDDYIKNRAYLELAHLYYLNKDYTKSISFLTKTAKVYQKTKDTEALSAIYNNIAILYKEQKNYKKGYQYLLKSIQLKDSIKNTKGLIESYNNMGVLSYLYKKNKDTAYKYYSKGLKLAKLYDLPPTEIYENIAHLYLDENQPDSAHYFIDLALKNAPENNFEKLRLYNTKLLIILKEKKLPEAIQILQIKDSIEKHNKEILDEENEKNLENKLSLISQEKKIEQARQINKKNRIIFIFIIIIFMLGVLISYQLNRLDRLRIKQEQIQLEQKVLRSQMNPHFIFNVLSSIQNSLVENNPILSATYLSKFAQLIRKNFEYVQKRYISLNEELEMLRNYLDTQKFRYKNKFEYEISIDPSINPGTTKMPPMILQPLVENSLEHAFKNIDYQGKISINITKKDHKICFEITDNGIGFIEKNDGTEHALDILKKRLHLIGKDAAESFKIIRLEQGTSIQFCFQSQNLLHKKDEKI